MDSDTRFTAGRVPDLGIRTLFSEEHRWQRWLDVEAALALAEANAGIVPQPAARAITNMAQLEKLDIEKIRADRTRMSHALMALVTELHAKVGQTHGGWVHWGATTQNITQTGDILVLREVHTVLLQTLGKMLSAMSRLADEGKDMICAGRTHGQQALPITFGFKVAAWVDEFARHIERLRQVEPRIFTAMIGGAVGNFSSLGIKGPEIQADMAKQLDLQSMAVPSRALSDMHVEYVCILGMIAGTCGKIANEVYHLMAVEFGEVSEPIPKGTIGSSTMPHKRNPQLAGDCVAIAAQIRSLVPLALEGLGHEYEVSCGHTYMVDDAMTRACILSGDLLTRMAVILEGLELHSDRMLANLELTGGLMSSEAIMLALGEIIGRQQAHEIIYEDAQESATSDLTFKETLLADSRVTKHLTKTDIKRLLDPRSKLGLSEQLSREAALRAKTLADGLKA
jgi:adenylosuccinate lyase